MALRPQEGQPSHPETGFESWGGYMNAKKQKLNEQFQDSKSLQESSIFEGVSIYVNGYTKPSMLELKELMKRHGGQFCQYHSKGAVTHIIASTLPYSKLIQLNTEKVMKPEWITDSIISGSLLPEDSYYLYPKLGKDRNISEFTTVSSSRSGASTSPTKAGRTLKAGDAGFVAEFYGHSRLHFLSKWRMKFKNVVKKLQSVKNPVLPGRERLKALVTQAACDDTEIPEQCYMHIDMDCFFVSVALVDRPHLRGKPVAVTHSRGQGIKSPRPDTNVDYERNAYRHASKVSDRLIDSTVCFEEENSAYSDELLSYSEIASCSYEAREAGVKNGMVMGRAKQLCPQLTTVPYEFEKYEEVANILYDTVAEYTHSIEAISCDELIIDCSQLLRDTGASPSLFATTLRQEVYHKSKCNASVGIGSNILLARLALRKAKPNGQYFLSSGSVIDFLKAEPVDSLPGIGWSVSTRLKEIGVETCGDLQSLPCFRLKQMFGQKSGQSLHDLCHGIDDRQLNSDKIRKSVSAEINYGIRFTTDDESYRFIAELAEEVWRRMQEAEVFAKQVTLKIKTRRADAPVETVKFMGHGVCDNVTKSKSVDGSNLACIRNTCVSLYKEMHVTASDLRGVGIQTNHLISADQRSQPISVLELLKKTARPTKSKSSNEPTFGSLVQRDTPSTSKELRPNPVIDLMSKQATATRRKEEKVPPPWVDRDVYEQLPADIQEEICNNHSPMSNMSKSTKISNAKRAVHKAKQTKKKAKPPGQLGISQFVSNGATNPRKRAVTSPEVVIIDSDVDNSVPNVHMTRTEPAVVHTETTISPPPEAPRDLKMALGFSVAQLLSYLDNLVSDLTQCHLGRVPDLNGATTFLQLRQIIKSWIDSTYDPLDDDISAIGDFFLELVEIKNMVLLRLCLHFMVRKIKEKSHPLWTRAVDKILEVVQTRMLERYGGKLELDY